METAKLKKFAQFARRSLMEQVSAKLKLVLAEDSAARRENPKAVAEIEKAISNQPSVISKGKEPTDGCRLTADGLIERVAYIWFNRFCALRFMDVNRYTRIGVVSPAEGQFQPEILAEAKMGHIDEEMVHDKVRQRIFALLDGKAPSRDPQGEAYRLLVVAACNFWNKAMPFLFQRIDDYTELLMPDDLLSGNSILAYTREAMTPDACGAGSNQLSAISNQKEKTDGCGLMADGSAAAGGVEVIGWLYQFYISEKKDEVFDGLKKNKKITPENIPAATQLFTPHWIVKYLVENSLGRLWMLNRPNSRLIDQMVYYIRPDTSLQSSVASNQRGNTDGCTLTTDYLRVSSPEEIRICDPACGSGHMLTYAFDLLYAIYEEEGYEPAEIPEKILTNNLYGIEIDERAGELAAFALTMKARARQRRFFNKGVKPNICVLENIHFDECELGAVVSNQLSAISKEARSTFLHDMKAFEQANNFGSLIRPQMTSSQIAEVEKIITDYCKLNTDIFEGVALSKALQALRQADYLGPKYHVVIANPPYMGGKGMNGRLAAWAKDNYPKSKSDLFSMFVERIMMMVVSGGISGLMTPFNWMFLGTYEKFRNKLLKKYTITNLLRPEFHAFFDSAYVSICAFTLFSKPIMDFPGSFIDLNRFYGAAKQPEKTLEAIRNHNCGWFFRASSSDFLAIPGSLIAYWLSEGFKGVFKRGNNLSPTHSPKKGLTTGDNAAFIRLWFEVSYIRATIGSGQKWFPMTKGGNFRKWYGNNEYFIDWEKEGRRLKAFSRSVVRNEQFYLQEGGSWNDVTMAAFSMRYTPPGFINNAVGPILYSKEIFKLIGLLNSRVSTEIFKILSPTMKFEIGSVAVFPLLNSIDEVDIDIRQLINLSEIDWDSYETSWDFTSLPLKNPDYRQPTLKTTYQKLRTHWQEMTLEMQRLEEENNRIFIEAYGLQDELTPEVPLNEITLTCNPHYRYGNDKSEDELEALLLADTMRELVSYAVGCMFGRYSLDAPGLILANQGECIDDYWRSIEDKRKHPDSHQPSVTSNQQRTHDAFTEGCKLTAEGFSSGFQPDEDNVIPILDGDWFTDDIAERFRKFLRVAFGEEHYEANLKFVEKALGKNGKARDIRDYFLKDFYSDHVKRYKKRPIYWLFSSPKGSFNALIYMHRYRPDTVSVVLNDYLREFRTKLTSHKNHLEAVSISASASQVEKTKALKEIEKVKKMITEMEEYEREVLYPLATEQVEIDLDDGVKVNYPKLGAALKKIAGLEAKED